MSINQLTFLLQRKGYAPEEIAGAVQKLLEWKYLDDHYYAISYCKSKKAKWSRSKIRNALLATGVDPELISSVLQEVYSEDMEYDNCLLLAQMFLQEEQNNWDRKYKLSSTYSSLPKERVLRKKVGDRLMRRGYHFPVVSRVLAELY